MDDVERYELMEEMIQEIQVYPKRQENGQWLKSIHFRLPIIDEELSIGLDILGGVENVAVFNKENQKTML